MKSLFFCMVIISLCSCGRSSQPESQNQSGENLSTSSSIKQFDLPKLNFQKVVTIDKEISTLYEKMGIDSKNQDSILGNNAFYIMINENIAPAYDEVHLYFSNKTKVNLVQSFDVKKTSGVLAEISTKNLASLKLQEVTDSLKDGMVWGKHDPDNSELDMLNKAYVVKTEEIQSVESEEFKSQSTYLVWFECVGNVQDVADYAYTCSKYNLKFHYKLLDYLLAATKN